MKNSYLFKNSFIYIITVFFFVFFTKSHASDIKNITTTAYSKNVIITFDDSCSNNSVGQFVKLRYRPISGNWNVFGNSQNPVTSPFIISSLMPNTTYELQFLCKNGITGWADSTYTFTTTNTCSLTVVDQLTQNNCAWS